MGKLFLSTVLIQGNTEKVSPAPLHELEILIPGFDSFDTIIIRSDGTIQRNSTSPKICPHIAVPIMYVSGTQSIATGDMEIEEEPLLLNEKFNVSLYRTRPFPAKKENCVILMSGCVNIPSDFEDLEILIGTLPDQFRPDTDKKVVCSLEGDYVHIDSDTGNVVVHLVKGSGSSRKISLDNVRYSLGSTGTIRARFPFRSLVYYVSPQGRQSFAPNEYDVFFPVTVETEKGLALSVVAFTQSGDMVPLGEAERIEKVVSEVLISSLLTGQPCPDRITPLSAPPDMDRRVYEKLSALTFSELSGEDLVKCIRRDKSWRHTGIKSKQ
jgi:hypothetical protein